MAESQKASTNEILRSLIAKRKELVGDVPIDIETADEAQLLSMRKKLSPFGQTIEGSGQVVTMSYVNFDQERMTKHLTTGLIGFLYRAADEYLVPDDVRSVPVEEYLKNPDALKPSADMLKRELPEQKAKREQNEADMQKRITIAEFLDSVFTFNPDKHARSAYTKPNLKDNKRRVIDTPAGLIGINMDLRKNTTFAADLAEYRKKRAAAETKSASTETTSATTGENPLPVLISETPDAKAIEYTKIPSADVFKKFQLYMDSHHEQLIGAVYDLYGLTPQFLLAFNAFSVHKDMDDADKFIRKHKDELVTEIHKVITGKWTIMEPFEQVRDSVRFNSDKMAIIDDMLAQSVEAEKLYKDMLEKKIEVKRRENQVREGKHDPAFTKFIKEYAPLKDMLPDSSNRKSAVDAECPPDAIQTNIFKIGGGGTTVEVEKLFTQADSTPPKVITGPKASEPEPKK